MQKLFAFTRALVNILFYLSIPLVAGIIILKAYQLFGGSRNLSALPATGSLTFNVMSFGNGDQQPEYRFSEEKTAAVAALHNRYLLHVAPRSPLGYYSSFIIMLLILCGFYGLWQLRGIFQSITPAEPFRPRNAARIRNIGLLFIASDLLKVIHYLLVNAFTAQYFGSGRFSMITEVGNGLFAGAIILVIAVVYARGVDIHSENQLTV